MCFSLQWFQQLLIWAVIIAALYGIISILVPFILGKLGEAGGVIAAVLNIILWAFIAIAVIYIVFALIACLLSMGGGLPLLPHAR